MGTWPRDRRLKEFGAATNLYMELSMEGFALYPIGEIMGWSKMEIDVLVAKLRTALLSNRNRNTGTMYVFFFFSVGSVCVLTMAPKLTAIDLDRHMVYGQKPKI